MSKETENEIDSNHAGIWASGFAAETTEKYVQDYMLTECNPPITAEPIEKITTFGQKRHLAFKIVVTMSDKDRALDPST